MSNLNSPLLRSQINQLTQHDSEDAAASLETFFLVGVVESNREYDLEIPDAQQAEMVNTWCRMIVSSLEITEQTLKFARQDANPFEIFLTNLHREFHLFADSDVFENNPIHPVVHKDLTGLSFVLGDSNTPIKLLDFARVGDTYTIDVIRPDATNLLDIVLDNSTADMDKLESLCRWHWGFEGIDMDNPVSMLAAMLGISLFDN